MLKETDMKGYWYGTYIIPPSKPRYHTHDTQLDEQAWCEKKDSKTFFSFILALSHSPPPPPPPLTPQGSFFSKSGPAMFKKPSEQGKQPTTK